MKKNIEPVARRLMVFIVLLASLGFATIYWVSPTPANNTNDFTYGIVFNCTTDADYFNATGNNIEIDGVNKSATRSSNNLSLSYTLPYSEHILNNTYDVRCFGNLSLTGVAESNETQVVPYYGCGVVNHDSFLLGNITSSTNCLTIQNGTVFGQGYKITATSTGSAVIFQPMSSNVSVRDSIINATSLSSYEINVILGTQNSNILIFNNTIFCDASFACYNDFIFPLPPATSPINHTLNISYNSLIGSSYYILRLGSGASSGATVARYNSTYIDFNNVTSTSVNGNFIHAADCPAGECFIRNNIVNATITNDGVFVNTQILNNILNGTATLTGGTKLRNVTLVNNTMEGNFSIIITSYPLITIANNTGNGTSLSITYDCGHPEYLSISGNVFTYITSIIAPYNTCGGSGGQPIIPPDPGSGDDLVVVPPPENPIGEVVTQIGIVGGGGSVSNTPVIASALIRDNEEIIGMAASTNIVKSSGINVILAEYQGLASLYLKLPFFEFINFGYVLLIVVFYLVFSSYKNLEKNQTVVTVSSLFGTFVIALVTSFVMLVNQGILFFALKVFGG